MDQHEPQIHDVWSKRPTRLSPEPLLVLTRDMPVRDAAAMLGINVGTLQKWRNGDTQVGIHYATADRIAVRHLNTHPSLIWGNDWWQI